MKFRSIAVAVLGTLVAGTAFAGVSPQTGSFQVTANVPKSCQIQSTAPIAFGSYDSLAASALDAAGSVVIRCSASVTNVYTTLDQGANAGTGSTDASPVRRMKGGSGSEFLSYQIYSDAARAVVWGNTATTGKNIAGPTVGGQDITHVTYGRVPAGQQVGSGNYADTVGVTVTF